MEQTFLNRQGKLADYSFHKCTVTVLSYWHRLTITCLSRSLPVVCFICQQCSTSKLLKYCGHLQVCGCTVHCLEFTQKSDNSVTFFCPGWNLHMPTKPGTFKSTDITGSAAVTSKFNCNQLMHDLSPLQCLSLYNYCICELCKKQTHRIVLYFVDHASCNDS